MPLASTYVQSANDGVPPSLPGTVPDKGSATGTRLYQIAASHLAFQSPLRELLNHESDSAEQALAVRDLFEDAVLKSEQPKTVAMLAGLWVQTVQAATTTVTAANSSNQ